MITDWKHLERLVMALQTKLGNGAVRHGELVKGRQSGTDRKLDVSVRGTIGSAKVFVVIDCAHLNDNVDVMKIAVAKTQREDVGADRAIVVTTRGFTDGAIKLAAANNIDTCIMRPATADDLAGRQQDLQVKVQVCAVVIEEIVLQLADGSTRIVAPGSQLQLQNEAGEEGDLERNVTNALINADPTQWSGKTAMMALANQCVYAPTVGGRAQVCSLRVRARHDIKKEVERTLTTKPGDWVFERVLPEGVESERVFFEFADLDDVARAHVILRDVILTTKCPIHKKTPTSVQVVWSLNKQKQRTAQFKIEPCCEEQDAAVLAALTASVDKVPMTRRDDLFQLVESVLAEESASGTGGA